MLAQPLAIVASLDSSASLGGISSINGHLQFGRNKQAAAVWCGQAAGYSSKSPEVYRWVHQNNRAHGSPLSIPPLTESGDAVCLSFCSVGLFILSAFWWHFAQSVGSRKLITSSLGAIIQWPLSILCLLFKPRDAFSWYDNIEVLSFTKKTEVSAPLILQCSSVNNRG